mmetsp:Transcript_30644/g.34938  ORF Transcript_30644/g.34938 Transcript_30644/m.34938 type:complete len:102 (-) Transcript_30644:158-463(-)
MSSKPSKKKITYGKGPPDLKSILINLSSLLLIVLPFAIYYDYERLKFHLGIVGSSFLIAVLIPPFGWMRPHPYSDMDGNRKIFGTKHDRPPTKNKSETVQQ